MMTAFRSLLLLAAPLALAVPAAAQNCISRAESQAVVAHLLPDLIESVEDRCVPLLGRGTFLELEGERLADSARPLSSRAWPAARQALERQSGSRLPDEGFILDIGRRAITDGIADGMDGEACRVTDELLAQLSPLPPENLANVFALFLEQGLNGDPNGALRVCPVGY